MRNIILVILFLSSYCHAMSEAPAWWKDSYCKKEQDLTYRALIKQSFTQAEAKARADDYFKTCVCQSADETKSAVDDLLDQGFEREIMANNGIVSVPIEYVRDFLILGAGNKCYLSIQQTDLCQNQGFVSAASQSFRIIQKYSDKSGYCDVDFSNPIFNQ